MEIYFSNSVVFASRAAARARWSGAAARAAAASCSMLSHAMLDRRRCRTEARTGMAGSGSGAMGAATTGTRRERGGDSRPRSSDETPIARLMIAWSKRARCRSGVESRKLGAVRTWDEFKGGSGTFGGEIGGRSGAMSSAAVDEALRASLALATGPMLVRATSSHSSSPGDAAQPWRRYRTGFAPDNGRG